MEKKRISTGAWIFLTALLLSAMVAALVTSQRGQELELQQQRSSALIECLNDSTGQYNSDLKLNGKLSESDSVEGDVYTADADTMEDIKSEKSSRDSLCHSTYGKN
jgi:hypothetical protein